MAKYTMTYERKGDNGKQLSRNFYANDPDDARNQAEAWLSYPVNFDIDGVKLISVARYQRA